MDPSIETISGKFVDFRNPCTTQITLRDIAHGLSRQSRYNGHTKGAHPYSVAQHSVWAAMIAQDLFGASQHATMLVLLHDAHEAYTGDIVSPLKYMDEIHSAIKSIESRLQWVIHDALDVLQPTASQRDLIQQVDGFALSVEAWHLMPSRGEGWTDSVVQQKLMDTFKPALDTQMAFELFWCAEGFIKAGHNLEELWRSI